MPNNVLICLQGHRHPIPNANQYLRLPYSKRFTIANKLNLLLITWSGRGYRTVRKRVMFNFLDSILLVLRSTYIYDDFFKKAPGS